MSEDKVHAKLSPSDSGRHLVCLGAIAFVESLNLPDTTSKWASEGTAAHSLGEDCLSNEDKPSTYLGKRIEADGMMFTVDQDMSDAVEVYYNYVQNIIEDSDDLDMEMHLEVTCSLKSLGIPGLDGGTSDCTIVSRMLKELHVIDYKHGAGVLVVPKDNTQAMEYALGQLIELGIGPKDNWAVHIAIVQPRCGDGVPQVWETTSKELFAWQDEVLIPKATKINEIIDIANDGESIVEFLTPSEKGCRWCDGKSECPKQYQFMQELAVMDFEDIENTSPPSVDSITPEQKTFVMEYGPMIKTFIDAVHSKVTQEMNAALPGYDHKLKLVQATTHRKYIPDAFDEIMSPIWDHLSEDEAYNKKPKGLGDLEKTLKSKIGAADAKTIMDEITIKPDGALLAAPLSDKRKSVAPAAQSDFEDL